MLRTLPWLLAVFTILAFDVQKSQAGDAVAGEARYKKTCMNCHGKNGKGVASFPSLVGRDSDYISNRLGQYRAKEKVGPNSAIMMTWASKLSDDEIANLAAYVSSAFE